MGVRDAKDSAKAILHEFTVRRDFFVSVMTIIKRLLAFIVFNIIRSAQKYHDRYLDVIDHDNRYITKFFKKIDARRALRGSSTLLPLKKIERSRYIDPYSIKLTTRERRNLIARSLRLIFEVFTTTIFIVLDYLLYYTLFLVNKHGKIEITQVIFLSLGSKFLLKIFLLLRTIKKAPISNSVFLLVLRKNHKRYFFIKLNSKQFFYTTNIKNSTQLIITIILKLQQKSWP